MRLVSLLLITTALLGCNTFEQRWNAAANVDTSTDAMIGRWEGSWTSTKSGHSGALKAVIERDEVDVYNAYFNATYARILTFKQEIPLNAKREGDRVTFQGEADLGGIWGKYQHDGYVKGDVYFSNYTSASDRGTFEMTRIVEP